MKKHWLTVTGLMLLCAVLSVPTGAEVAPETDQVIHNEAILLLADGAINRSGLAADERATSRRRQATLAVTDQRLSLALSRGLRQFGAQEVEVSTRKSGHFAKRHYRTGRIADLTFLLDYVLVRFEEGIDAGALLPRLAALPEVKQAHLSSRAVGDLDPDDTDYDDQYAPPIIEVDDVWASYKGEDDASIVVGAYDFSGINDKHQDLEDNVHALSDTTTYGDSPGWADHHGTATAAVVSAVTDNDNAIAGISWNSRIFMVHSDSSSSSIDIMFALNDLADSSDVIYHSWGLGTSDHSLDSVLTVIDQLGIFQAGSAANNGADQSSIYRAPGSHPRCVSR